MVSIGRRTSDWYPSRLHCLAGSWLLAQTVVLSGIFALSLGNHLTAAPLGCWMLFWSTALWRTARPPVQHAPVALGSPRLRVLFCLAVLVLALLTYRACYYFDTTWDSLTGGSTRVALYTQSRSVFAAQPTRRMGIICNEWNAELNALYYGVLTGDDQAINFSGVEIWALHLLALTLLGRTLGLRRDEAPWGALLIGTAPALLCAAVFIKGDLLASAAVNLALAFHLSAPGPLTGMAILAWGMAAGAKITVVPVAGLAILLALGRLLRSGVPRRVIPALALALLITNIRYVANIGVYRAPFQRGPGERLHHNPGRFPKNLAGLARWTFEGHYPAGLRDRVYWGIESGYGYVGQFLAGTALLALVTGARVERPRTGLLPFALGGAMLLGVVMLANAMPWHPWSFRYYLPWITSASCVLLAAACRRWPRLPASLFLASLLVMTLDIRGVTARGELHPVLPKTNQLARKLAFHPYFYDQLMAAYPDFIHRSGLRVLLDAGADGLAYPFFGINTCNVVTFVNSTARFLEQAASGQYDILATTGKEENTQDISREMRRLGYELRVNNASWRLFGKGGER